MKNVLVNWRTTLAGVAGILAIVSRWAHEGTINMDDLTTIWMLLTSMGLIAAKDSSVTGVF